MGWGQRVGVGLLVVGGGCCGVVDFGNRKEVSPRWGLLVKGAWRVPRAYALGYWLSPRWGLVVEDWRPGSGSWRRRAAGFRPYWGCRRRAGRLGVGRRDWGSTDAVRWQLQVRHGGIRDGGFARYGGRQVWRWVGAAAGGRFEDGPSLRCSRAAAHDHCYAWVSGTRLFPRGA